MLYTDCLFQMIVRYCDVKKEVITELPGESPLTSFSQLQSADQTTTSTSPQKNSGETTVKWVLPEDFPIDLRVKIAVCLIHVRQLGAVKVSVLIKIIKDYLLSTS